MKIQTDPKVYYNIKHAQNNKIRLNKSQLLDKILSIASLTFPSVAVKAEIRNKMWK